MATRFVKQKFCSLMSQMYRQRIQGLNPMKHQMIKSQPYKMGSQHRSSKSDCRQRNHSRMLSSQLTSVCREVFGQFWICVGEAQRRMTASWARRKLGTSLWQRPWKSRRQNSLHLLPSMTGPLRISGRSFMIA